MLPLLAGCANSGHSSRGHSFAGEIGPVPGYARQAAVSAPIYAAPREARRADEPVWSAQVEYRHVIDRPDLVARGKRNEEVARPGFATLKRSFGTGEFRPYVGMGVGVAATQFESIAPTVEDRYAVKAVVGSQMRFTDKVGGYVQYDYAVATESEIDREERKAHGIRFGFSISLN